MPFIPDVLPMFQKLAVILRCVLAFGFALASIVSSPAVAVAKDAAIRQEMVDVGGYRLNSVYLKAGKRADLPPIVFIHGASANLFDPMLSFRDRLQGRADLLFVDRPGHGRSDRGGPQNAYPDGQADAIATLMKKRGIAKAIIVSHSLGGAVAASFALNHKDMVIGLVFLSPAVYPWPGGTVWYYHAAKAPVTGWLFSALVVPPVGLAMIDRATRAVFAPNPRPADYIERTHALMALEPASFRYNAADVANLSDWAAKVSPRYREIRKPTVIITGDADGIVSPKYHSQHLARDIRGARLISIHNLGHKSDYVAGDLAVAAIETVAGEKRDLAAIARRVEARIVGDREK
jgi:pimeloyl-ACP methyl ester carboxylesterase